MILVVKRTSARVIKWDFNSYSMFCMCSANVVIFQVSHESYVLNHFGGQGIILLLLLVSGSVVYLRRKQTVTMPGAAAGAGAGAGRIQMNRF